MSLLKIENEEDIFRLMSALRGADPNAIQAVANFMNLKSTSERSNFRNEIIMLCDAQLKGFGKIFYPKDEWDPFTLVAEVIGTATMGYKGFKSNQFVEMTRQSPDLSALQGEPADVKQGLLSRVLGRGGVDE